MFWIQGMLTGLLGNLSLLSYFIKKREKEAIVVQTLGVVSTYVVISQLAVGEAMPMPHFIAISVVVATGLVLNFLNYFNMLNAGIWRFWEDVITVGGLTALPQVISLSLSHLAYAERYSFTIIQFSMYSSWHFKKLRCWSCSSLHTLTFLCMNLNAGYMVHVCTHYTK